MEENFKNPNLISSVDAAVLFGITNDYVTMLCRRKKVSGMLVGKRLWFVDKVELEKYLVEVKLKEETRHQALSQQLKQEYVAASQAVKVELIESDDSSESERPVPVPSPIQRRSFSSKYVVGAVVAMIFGVSGILAAPSLPHSNEDQVAAVGGVTTPEVLAPQNIFGSFPTAGFSNGVQLISRGDVGRVEFEDRLFALTQFVIDYGNTRTMLGGHSHGGGGDTITNVTNITSSGTSNFGQTFEMASGALVPTTTLGIIVASSTVAGDFTVTGGLRVASLVNCDTIDTDANGNLSCGTDQTATGAGNAFNFAANYGVLTAATTSPIWAQAGIFASSTSHFASLDVINATSTNFAITSVASSLLKTDSSGNVLPAVAGTDYLTSSNIFAYPFPNNATTTTLTFTNGLTIGNASVITSANSQFALGPSGSGGQFGGGGGLLLQSAGNIFWSSTGSYAGVSDIGLGRSSAGVLAVNGGKGSGTLGDIVANRLGLGTTSPFAQLTVVATSTNGVGSPTTLFAIASTSQGNSTTTLFSISNSGVASSSSFVAQAGGATAPAYGFSNQTGSGMSYLQTVFGPAFSASGVFHLGVSAAASSPGAVVASSDAFMWSAGSISAGSVDTFLSRQGAGVVRVGTALSNMSGTLLANTIGLGTTSPLAKLTVGSHDGSIATPLFLVASSSTGVATSTLFIVSGTGNVGIGTTSPDDLLTIAKDGDAYLKIQAITGTGQIAGIKLQRGNTSSAQDDYTIADIAGNLRIDASSGNPFLGINTTPDATLSIKTSTNLPILNFYGINTVVDPSQFNPGVIQVSDAGSLLNPNGRPLALQPNAGSVLIGTTTGWGRLTVWATSTSQTAKVFELVSTASTTLFSVNNIGTTTLGNFGACNTTSALTTDSSGNITCGALSFSSSGGQDFTYGQTNFGQTVSATSTALWFQQGFMASSTARIGSTTFDISGNVGIGTASPTAPLTIQTGSGGNGINLLATGGSNTPFVTWQTGASKYSARYFGGSALFFGLGDASGFTQQIAFQQNGGVGIGFTGGTAPVSGLTVNGLTGIGTSTPFALLSLHATSTGGGSPTTLFAIASSSQGNSTTTLFVVSNSGNVGIGTSTPARKLDIEGGIGISVASGSNGYGININNNGVGVVNFQGFDNGTSFAFFGTNRTFSGSGWNATGWNASRAGATMQVENDKLIYYQFAGSSNTPNPVFQINSAALGSGIWTSGNIGLGTTSPFAKLSVASHNGSTLLPLFLVASSSTGVATSSIFVVDGTGRIGIGTSSPYAKLSISANNGEVNTTLFAISSSTSATTTSLLTVNNSGLVSIGADGSNLFSVDAITGSTTIANLNIGNLSFDTNAGYVALSNIPVDSNAPVGTPQAQSIQIDDVSILTVSAESLGNGFIRNTAVGIGTTSPRALLNVVASNVASSTTNIIFAVGSSTALGVNSTFFSINNVGTTTLGNFGACNTTSALTTDSSGNITCGAISSGSSFSYPFPNAATSTLLTFSGGIISSASSTIGNGNQNGGLTINGGATTTGNLVVSGNVTANAGSFTTSITTLLVKATSGTTGGLCVISRGCLLGSSSGSDGLLYLADFGVGTTFTRLGFGGQTTSFPALTRSGTSLSVTLGDGTFAGSSFGVGTTSPFAKLAISLSNGETNTNAFIISSSTASATTTLFSISNTGTTTLGNFGACNTTSALTTDSSGNIICGSVSGSGSSGADFTYGQTNFGQTVSATSTALWFQQGFMASSTSVIGSTTFAVNGNVGIGTTSPFSKLSVSGNILANNGGNAAENVLFGDISPNGGFPGIWFGTNANAPSYSNFSFLYDSSNGTILNAPTGGIGLRVANTTYGYLNTNGFAINNGASGPGAGVGLLVATGSVGVGSSSPFGLFSIHANNGSTNPILFAIGSSTANSTTTLFTVKNTGQTSIGSSSPSAFVAIHVSTTSQYAGKEVFAISSSTATGATTTLFSIDNTGSTTAANGMNITAGCFAQRGNCVSTFAYPFPAAATTTLLTFNGGATTTKLTVSGGYADFSVAATTTVVNNNPFAFTIATSTTARPIFRIDTTAGAETVTFGSGYGTDVIIGDVGATTNLVFEENSTIKGQGPGRTLTIGANSDIINFGVNVGIGSSSPFARLSIHATSTTGAASPKTLFAIASSSQGNSTSTLFTISNTGVITTVLGDGCVQVATGVLTSTGSPCGSSGGTFPFITATNFGTTTAATSTQLWFQLGLMSSSTARFETGLFNNTVGVGSTSPFALLSIHAASTTGTTTLFAIASTSNNGAISTLFSVSNTGAITTTLVDGCVQAAAGVLSSTGSACGSGGGGAFPFTITTNFGQTVAATSTTLWAQAGLFASSTSVLASTTFLSTGLVGIASSTPWGIFSINPVGLFGNIPSFVIGSSTRTQFVITASGNVGIGTSSPYAKLSISANNGETNTTLFAISSSTSATTTTFLSLNNAGLFSVGADNSNLFSVDALTGSTTIANLSIGNINFESNAGVVNLSNIPVDSNAAAGVQQSQSLAIDDISLLTVYAESNGTGFIRNTAVGIGSTSPRALLSVYASPAASSTTNMIFTVASSTAVGVNSTFFAIDNTGSTTIGNGTASTGLVINGFSTTTGNAVIQGTLNVIRNVAPTQSGTQLARFGTDFSGGLEGYGGYLSFFSTGSGAESGRIYNITDSTGNIGYSFSTFEGGILKEKIRFSGAGDIGLGTTTPFGHLSIATHNGSVLTPFFNIASSSTGLATSSIFIIAGTGNIGIGTSSPYAKLSVVGEVVASNFTATSTTATSTLSGGLNVGSGALTYDFSSGLTTIQNLAVGAQAFDTDGGIISWVDMAVSSAAATGTVESYGIQIDGNPIMTIYSESNGSGSIKNTNVGIGSTTPWAQLSVFAAPEASSTSNLIFAVGSSTAAGNASTFFTINNQGVVGIGTTTPTTKFGGLLAVAGPIFVGGSPNTATSTFEGNVQIQGTLQVGTSSIYFNGNPNNTTGPSIGVGTSSSFAKLSVHAANGEISKFLFAVGSSTATATTTLFVIDNVGNVGIGTTTGSQKLTITGSAPKMMFYDTTNNRTATYGSDGFNAVVDSIGGGWTILNVSGANRLTLEGTNQYFNTGNLGIGTTSPFANLSIHANNGSTNKFLFAIGSSTASATTTLFSVDNAGITTVGDSSGTGNALFQFASDANAWTVGYNSTDKSFNIASSTNLSSGVGITVQKNLNVGISSTTPWRTLSVTGTVGFSSSLSTGTGGNYLCIDTTTWQVLRGNGSSCTASSMRFKEHVNNLEYGLDDLMKLRPVSYNYKKETNMGDKRQLGFIAEEVQQVIPELVTYDNTGNVFGLDYPLFTSVLAKALQDLNEKVEVSGRRLSTSTIDDFITKDLATSTDSFKNSVLTFFESMGDALQGGIRQLGVAVHATVAVFDTLFTETLTATVINADEVNTKKLCLEDVCVTKDELQQLLQGNGGSSSNGGNGGGDEPAPPPTPQTASSTPSVDDSASSTPDVVTETPEPPAETPVEIPAEDPAPEPTPDPVASDSSETPTP